MTAEEREAQALKYALVNDGPLLTRQELAADADVNRIVKQFGHNAFHAVDPVAASGFFDFTVDQTQLYQLRDAAAVQFAQLPADIREAIGSLEHFLSLRLQGVTDAELEQLAANFAQARNHPASAAAAGGSAAAESAGAPQGQNGAAPTHGGPANASETPSKG